MGVCVGVWGVVEFDAEFKFAKIQNSDGGGGGENQISTFGAESKFAKKKFSDKEHNGFVLDFEYQVVPLYEV